MYSTCKQVEVKGRAYSLQYFGKGVLPRDFPKKILAFQMDVPAPRWLKMAFKYPKKIFAVKRETLTT